MINNIIPLFKVFMTPELKDELIETLYSGYIGEGPKVLEFEKNLKKYFENTNILTLNTGTSALHLAYHLCLNDIKNSSKFNFESEVISTPVTCTATNTPIINNFAKIVWADVNPETGNICPKDIERKITKKTKAISMVHWGGNPCEIEEINLIAKKYGIKTIEDGAHSMSMIYKNKKFGSFSDFSILSLQAIKHITSVDGGLIFTKSIEDYERIKLLRWYGINREAKEGIDLRCELDVAEAGFKFHMNDICALIGNANFKFVDKIVNKHRQNAKFYDNVFEGKVDYVKQNKDGQSSYWLYTINVKNRDELMLKLKDLGIMSSKVHARNDTHSMFKDFRVDLPGVDKFNQTHLCIPVGWWLTESDLNFISDNVIKYSKK